MLVMVVSPFGRSAWIFVFGKGKFYRKQKEKRNFCCELLFKGVWS